MSVGKVENYLARSTTLSCIKKFTLVKSHMSAVNVGNLLARALASLDTRELTLEKGLMSGVNGKSFTFNPNLLKYQNVHKE